jgi:hypothetical protein
VTTGATYRYRVKALSRTGTLSTAWSSYSASVAAGGDTTPPGVITSPSITGQLGSIFASWTNPTDDDLSHVKIYRHTANVSGSSTFVGSVLSDNATLYVPLASTTYYFWAATVDRTGNEGAKTALGSAQALPVGDLAELDTVGTSRIDAGAVTATELADNAVDLAGAKVTGKSLANIDSAAATKLAGIEAGATDDSAVTALAGTLGPLATSALTEAKVQGRWFGQYAGDSAANTAGLQNGDSYVDTSVYPPVLKGKTGGTIYEISETGILLDTDTDVDLVGTGTTFTDVHSYTLPAAVSTSSFFVIQLGLSIVSGTTVSGSGVTAPSGLWQLYEFDSASTDATKRLVHSGAWASQIIGSGPNAANLTDITVDGDNYSDISRQWKFKFGGGGILKLRMHQGGGPNLSNAQSHIRVTIQRN